jgi:putative ABC transport system ATP-binding protein
MSVLELKNVGYRYEKTMNQILRDVCADFDAGKVYAIVGRSGSGKSTLLSLISGLDIATEGEVHFEGRNLKDIDRDRYRAQSIGVVFQSYNLLLNATAVENIVLSLNISSNPEADKKTLAYGILEKVGIDQETADRKILKLSGGEQQRVGIARAIANHPDIIIADEPTGNLDEATEDEVLSILSSLAHDEGKCVIIVTHSRDVAGIADEVWGIKDGRLIEIDMGN